MRKKPTGRSHSLLYSDHVRGSDKAQGEAGGRTLPGIQGTGEPSWIYRDKLTCTRDGGGGGAGVRKNNEVVVDLTSLGPVRRTVPNDNNGGDRYTEIVLDRGWWCSHTKYAMYRNEGQEYTAKGRGAGRTRTHPYSCTCQSTVTDDLRKAVQLS